MAMKYIWTVNEHETYMQQKLKDYEQIEVF